MFIHDALIVIFDRQRSPNEMASHCREKTKPKFMEQTHLVHGKHSRELEKESQRVEEIICKNTYKKKLLSKNTRNL